MCFRSSRRQRHRSISAPVKDIPDDCPWPESRIGTTFQNVAYGLVLIDDKGTLSATSRPLHYRTALVFGQPLSVDAFVERQFAGYAIGFSNEQFPLFLLVGRQRTGQTSRRSPACSRLLLANNDSGNPALRSFPRNLPTLNHCHTYQIPAVVVLSYHIPPSLRPLSVCIRTYNESESVSAPLPKSSDLTHMRSHLPLARTSLRILSLIDKIFSISHLQRGDRGQRHSEVRRISPAQPQLSCVDTPGEEEAANANSPR